MLRITALSMALSIGCFLPAGSALVVFGPVQSPAAALRLDRPQPDALETDKQHWIGTWATAPQPFLPARLATFRNQTVRLIVHASTGGTKVRIRVSNTFGDQPVLVGAAHIARRAAAADIDPASDRALTFFGRSSATIAAGSLILSDPVDLPVPALSDLAVSLSAIVC